MNSRSSTLAEIWINPLTGVWSFPDFPEQVELLGRQFKRANWLWEDGSVQYREVSDTSSMHLKVRNGQWRIDHIDKVNPDSPSVFAPLGHFLSDTTTGKFIASLASVAGIVIVGRWLFQGDDNVRTIDLVTMPSLGDLSITPTWSAKRERQYKHILDSCVKSGKRKPSVCRKVAAATVNKQRAVSGEAKTVGCHCPRLTVPLKHDKDACYDPKRHARVSRQCLIKE